MACIGAILGVPLLVKSLSSPAGPYPPSPDKSAAYAPPDEQQKQWALALSATLAEQNEERQDVLLCTSRKAPHDHSACVVSRLRDAWGVQSRQELLEQLTWLENGGHRRGYDRRDAGKSKVNIAAWDYGRYVALCRWGYSLGYLSESETWQRIMPVARLMQKTYSSWQEYSGSYVTGREYWSPGQSDAAQIREINARLLAEPQSPWVQLPWKLDLTSNGRS